MSDTLRVGQILRKRGCDSPMKMFWRLLKNEGFKAAINHAAERACMHEIKRMHDEAKLKGHNLIAPEHKSPWWFFVASKIESWTRP